MQPSLREINGTNTYKIDMSKSIDFIENESFVVVNPDYPVILKENALIAVDIADKEAKDKAIEVYKNSCSYSPIGCCMIKRGSWQV